MPCSSMRFRKVSPSNRLVFPESTWWMNAVLREDVWSLLDIHPLNRTSAQNRRVRQPSIEFDATKLRVSDDGQYRQNHPTKEYFENECYCERIPLRIDASDTNPTFLRRKRRRHQSTDVPRILRIGNVAHDVAVLFLLLVTWISSTSLFGRISCSLDAERRMRCTFHWRHENL